MKTSKIKFGTSADELAIDLMMWLNSQPDTAMVTLKAALYKLGLNVIEVEDNER